MNDNETIPEPEWETEPAENAEDTEKAVKINEIIPELVEETEPAENAEDTDQSVNAIRAAEISIYTWT